MAMKTWGEGVRTESRTDSSRDSILERIAKGDELAVQECIDRFGGLVWTVARRFASDTNDAEDAVQEIFVELWTHAKRYDPAVASESTFVTMIARRRLIDRLRKRQRQPQAEVLNENLDLASHDPSASLDDRDEAGRVAELIRTLRPEQQRVLHLAIHDGWSHRTISDHLEMPLGTVKTHLRRGLLRVRELWETSQRGGKSR